MSTKVFAFFAWGVLLLITYLTLAPIGMRPYTGHVRMEHFLAFATLGLLFGLAYPRHILLVTVIVLGSCLALELFQFITPDRHGRWIDAAVKGVGGVSGILASLIVRLLPPMRA
jgi:hypothetical protein